MNASKEVIYKEFEMLCMIWRVQKKVSQR